MKKIIFSLSALLTISITQAQLANTKWKGRLLGDYPRNVMLNFQKDKFDVYTISDSSLVEAMTIAFENNNFSVKKINGQSDCDNMSVGKYEFTMRKDSLFIKKITDDCNDRSTALDATAWTKWKDYREVKVDEFILKEYVGVYELDANHRVTVGFENGRLYLESETNNLPKSTIYAISKTKFYVKIAATEVDFVRDSNGKVIKFISHEEKNYELKKIK